MSDLIVVLADFAVAVVCMTFCWKLWTQRASRPDVNDNVFGFFGAIGLTAAVRGLADSGEFFQVSGLIMTIFMLNALAAYNVWLVVTHLVLNSPRSTKIIRWVLRVLYILLIIAAFKHIVGVSRESYLPATIVLFALLSTRVLRFRNRFYFLGWGGLALIFAAAWVRHARFDIHPQYFDHRVLNQFLLGFGLWGLYLFGSRIARWNM